MSEGPLPAFGLIQPENIPGRTIDVGQIQDAAQLLDTKAHAIRVQGALVESEWDALAGVYDAPEAPDLFLLLKGERGVGTRTDALASNFSKAASALTTLSYAIASTVQELKDLHAHYDSIAPTKGVTMPVDLTFPEAVGLIRKEFGPHVSVQSINSKTLEVVFVLYDAFPFVAGVDERYGSFGMNMILSESKAYATFFLGQRTTLRTGEAEIREALRAIDQYCRLRLPDKYLEAFDAAVLRSTAPDKTPSPDE